MGRILTGTKRGQSWKDSLLHAHSQQFFNRFCEKRALEYEQKISPKEIPYDLARAYALTAYLEQSCLEFSSKRLLRELDLSSMKRYLCTSPSFATPPEHPEWIALPRPTLLHHSEQTTFIEPVAALFFYNFECPNVLHQALVPPVVERPWTKEDPLTSAWWEWQLDFIDYEGITLSDYRYSYDQRTARWKKMEGSTCRWNLCQQVIGKDLEDVQVIACHRCQEALDYYSRWLATLLNKQIGQKISLQNREFEVKKRVVFERFRLARL